MSTNARLAVLISLLFSGLLFVFTANAQTGCPDPEWVCENYHPGSELTGFCGISEEDCLGKNYGEEITLVPLGKYATKWLVKTEGILVGMGFECLIFDGNTVSTLEIPYEVTGIPVCAAVLKTQDHRYAEHFASNTVSGCFGWAECKLE
jgi:hypothetical protein